MTKAFEQWNRPEWAEMLLQKHTSNEELIPDTFSDLKIIPPGGEE